MRFDELEEILNRDGIVFLSYGGFLTQSLISGMTHALEKEAKHNNLGMKVSSNILTIFIELSQNMMNYSKSKADSLINYESKGLVIVGMENDAQSYYIISRNLVNAHDMAKIQKRLLEIEGLDKEALRLLYREKRKAGKEMHDRGAGIGFIEIARRCDKIEHQFTRHDDEHYFFTLKTTINKD